ncbi:ATP-binding protein [Nitratifractor sp.]
MDSILVEDNLHWTNPDAYGGYVDREILPKAEAMLEPKEVLAIVGARRVGKSTLAKLLIRALLQRGVEARNVFFINLEKPSFIPYKQDPSYLQKIYEAYLKLAEPDRSQRVYVFMDEVQIFQNWEVFVKAKYESENIKFVITGSNSSLLGDTFATLLTGRVLKLRLHSFSFTEFLRFKKIDFSTKIALAQNRLRIEKAQEEYMRWGGYYSVIASDSDEIKMELLANIAEDIILKDIVPRHKIKNSAEIRDLFHYLVSNATTLLNYSSLGKKLDLDAKTVKEYIGYFEDNYLITLLSRQHNKVTEAIRSTKKVYFNDNGFLNLGVTPQRNFGIALENLVFTALNRTDQRITYLREKSEVDFLVGETLIQVAYDIEDEKVLKRELKGIEEFRRAGQRALLITPYTDGEADDVEIMSFYRFVLTELNRL